MKISVITLHNINNYGSALQTYATQTVLEKMGYEVEFVNYYRDGSSISKRVATNLKFSNIYNKNFLFRFIGKTILTLNFKKQDKVFKKFLNEKINLTKKYENFEELKENPPIADFYCTGSDQVWNSEWNSKIDPAYFLDFVSDGVKKVSFASSFGKSAIDEEEEKKIKPFLEKYNYITVRENSANKILKNMGIESKVILDPTLLLSKNDWCKIIEDLPTKKKYIFVYQLNTNFKKFDLFVKELSKTTHLPVIRLSVFWHQIFKYGKLDFCPKIEKFITYIKNADYVVSDSFHCTAFAINFNKKFAAIYPPKFSTRLENILIKTNLLSRKVNSINDLKNILEEINYDKVNKLLSDERKKSLEIVRNMFGENR